MLLILALGACRREPAMSETLEGVPVLPGAARISVQSAADAVGEVDADPDASRDDHERYRVDGAALDDARAWYEREMRRLGWHRLTDERALPALYLDAQGCQALVAMRATPQGLQLDLTRQRPPCRAP